MLNHIIIIKQCLLDLCLCLFKKISKKVADSLGYNYPDYDENVTKYLETQKRISNKYLYGNRY